MIEFDSLLTDERGYTTLEFTVDDAGDEHDLIAEYASCSCNVVVNFHSEGLTSGLEVDDNRDTPHSASGSWPSDLWSYGRLP